MISARGVFTATNHPDVAPRRVLIDTTLVVEAMIADQPGQMEAAAILDNLAASGAEIVFNRLMEIEMLQAASYVAGRHAPGNRRAGLRDGRVRRRSRRMAIDLRSTWHDFLDRVTWQRIELEVVTDAVHEVMFGTGLSSYDAVHAATAIAADCDAIATLDSDFGRLPAAQVGTIITTPHRLARTRRLRATT